DPRNVVERHRVGVDVDVVSDGQIASPHDLPLGPPGGPGKVHARDIDPHRISELPDHARRVREQKRRISLGDLQSGKAEQHARGIRIADSRSGYLDIAAGPAPGSRVPLRTATNFVILARELEMN